MSAPTGHERADPKKCVVWPLLVPERAVGADPRLWAGGCLLGVEVGTAAVVLWLLCPCWSVGAEPAQFPCDGRISRDPVSENEID